MKDTRLIRLIRTFSREELKSFGKFLESPFLKPKRNTFDLYEYIIKFYPEYDSSKLKKENVFGKLFPGEKYFEGKLNNLIFELSKAAENFLAYKTLMEDETEYLLNLSKGYLSKNLSGESNRINKMIEKKLKPGFSQSKNYVSKFRWLTYLKNAYYTEHNDIENVIECTKNYFEASAIQFIVDYTEIVGAMKPAFNTYGKNVENNFIQAILRSFDIEKLHKLIEENEHTLTPIISLYYYKLKAEDDPDNSGYYYSLKDSFYRIIPKLDREEKYRIFSELANYCVQKSVKKNEEFKKEGLKIYQEMMANNAYSFSENEYMLVAVFRNIIQFCISVNEIKWFEYFIENYTDCLKPEYRKDLRHYSFAHLYFMKKDFEKSLVMISEIDYEFFLFKPDFKNLMLKIYYELGHYEQAFSMVDTYRHFLANTKEISKTFKKYYNNYLSFYYILLKIRSGQSKESPLFLKSKIEKENEIINKAWLLEKVKEISRKK